MAEWARTAATTIRDYGQSYEETLLRNQSTTALLVDGGRVMFNQGGDGFDWAVQFARGTPETNRGDQAVDYDAINRFMRANLDYYGYTLTDSMNKLEFLKNRGKPALIKYFSEMGELLFDDMGRHISQQIYNRGQSSANPNSIYGYESWLYQNGSSINATTGAIRSYNAADPCAAPSDTYASVATDLGNYGGTVTGVWPNNFTANNDGDTYDFFSPVLVNYNSTYFAGTANTWLVQCTDALRFAITATQKDSSPKGRVNLIQLAPELFRQFKSKNDSLQRINIENTEMRRLGFTDTINLDGVDIKGEFGVPNGVGYGINTRHMSLRSMQAKLFMPEGPTWHPQSRSYRTLIDFMGNLQIDSPKYFFKLAAYTGAAG